MRAKNGCIAFKDENVLEKFMSYPDKAKKKMLLFRRIIFDTAADTHGVGALEKTLKWGEPSYLTSSSKNGSTIRINYKNHPCDSYFINFNCRTKLIRIFKGIYGDLFKYSGNRSILFTEKDKIPIKQLSHCIAIALTYHRCKKDLSTL